MLCYMGLVHAVRFLLYKQTLQKKRKARSVFLEHCSIRPEHAMHQDTVVKSLLSGWAVYYIINISAIKIECLNSQYVCRALNFMQWGRKYSIHIIFLYFLKMQCFVFDK